ncbi:unnamed protein product [Arctia plantaginis]|uniref:Uncharacterized protein n=1 Tax=Arctia plantaginis TaxID=874455 RepID=A0A8S1AWI5_ARCPL|nr:unnamed protein product [Arctia plantaginis]
MDVGKLLKDVNSLNEYIDVTQDSSEKCTKSRIQLNMTTVLALKKIRSLEVEYVNKCEEIGIASVIFERMLHLPPSKTWGVLSKEMVSLLRYWLDAVRKHLVKHSPHWWKFLKSLLRFLKEIRLKDNSMPNILVEHTAECLFDLATTNEPDAMQRYEILHCFNMYCSESTREIRFALRSKFGQYFIKLATYMSKCGNLPTQYSIMETLLRWLVPRQDRTLRITSASKWFPVRLYTKNVIDIFLERPWMNFFQDARDLLNAHNESSNLITSVICRKLTFGDIIIIKDTDKTDSWLDLNSASKCMSVLLDPRVLDAFGCTNHKSFETFVVSEDNTETAKLSRESDILTLSVQTFSPPRVLPSCIKLGDDVSCHVTALISSRSDVKRLDGALRMIFNDKYQLLLDLEKEAMLSPPKATEHSNEKSKNDPRFSHPVEVRRRKHSGYIVKTRQPHSCMSPSTASTSSLAQLHEKLAALPRYKFEKESLGVCAPPDLSIVTEVSEADAQSITTLNRKAFGVCDKNNYALDSSKKSQSDSETSRKKPELKTKAKGRLLSPIVREETPSCLLVATIGSADDSVINDTIERLSKSKDYDPDNIVNLLVQEALNAKKKDQIDSGINAKENTSQELNDNIDAIDNTPKKKIDLIESVKKYPKVVSPTSDESNTEAISDTPNEYVNTRRKKKDNPKSNCLEKNCFDVHVVEEFFSQHFTGNREQEVIISPTLAKKINETSSEFSDGLLDDGLVLMGDESQNLDPFNINNIEVIECLNNIVDKVCDEFNKCSEYLNRDQETVAGDISDLEDDLPLKDILCKIQNVNAENKIVNKVPQKPKKIKLKYKVSSKKENMKTRTIRKNKLEVENAAKMSTIMEDNAETVVESNVSSVVQENIEINNENAHLDNAADVETPMLRRKRKLFSPKDEKITEEAPMNSQENDFINSKINKTPKSTLSYKPYKDIEQERQRYIRMPRNRKSKKIESPSPRTKKMNELFEKVKESSNSEPVKLINRASDVYNFSTDSEEEFKEKKIAISKKNSITTVGSEECTVLRRGRVVKRTNYASKDEGKKRKVTRRQRTKKIEVEPVNDLIDEKMREQKEVLDTSVVIEIPRVLETAPLLVLENPPQMEAITDKDEKTNIKQQKTKGTKKTKSKTINLVKGAKKIVNIKPNSENDRTESPLPGLVVEEARTPKTKGDGDLSANMIDKFKKICQNPEKYINESNNTQILLSDNDKNINSPQNFNVTDEFLELELQTKDELRRNRKDPKTEKPSTVKPKRKAKEKNIEKDTSKKCTIRTLSLPGSETKSDQSISTVGITGHGDSEEAPPSPKLIVERLEHRNLESEYLDRSIKKYFDKLTEEINNINSSTHDNSNDKNKTTVTNKSDKLNKEDIKKKSSCSPQSLKSPVVSIERMSLEDISRWLPSRRNSESDTDSSISRKSKTLLKNSISSNIVESKHDTDSENYPEIQETAKKPLIKENSPVVKVNHTGEHSKSLLQNNDCSKSTQSKKICVIRNKNDPKLRVVLPRRVKNTPKSCISPIKLFEDCDKNVDKLSQSTLSDDQDYINGIKDTFCNIVRRRKIQSQSSKAEESIKELSHAKENEIDFLRITPQINLTQNTDSESILDKMSTSTKIADCKALKRKLEENRNDSKKKKVEDNNNMGDFISASGNTESSVDEWFKRNEPSSSRGEALNTSVRDSLHNVMEKLDTTLIEIHQNTSKKFVHLFVSAQQQLCELKEERHKMYKRVAADLLASVVQLMDDKFCDLDKMSQEQDMNFMKQLKEQTSGVIREDCKQKRVMVQLLKEDVQAVLEHMKRSTD